LLFLLRLGAFFQPVGFAYLAGFRGSVIEFGAMRLNLSAALVGGHIRSRSCVMLLISSLLKIVIWYGAVIAQSGRQFDEMSFYISTEEFRDLHLIFAKIYTLFMAVLYRINSTANFYAEYKQVGLSSVISYRQ